MSPEIRSRVIGERNLLRSMEMSFFVVCPYIFLICAPKIGMNRMEIILSSSSCNSSRFSGPCTRSYLKGIPQKKTSSCSSVLSFLGEAGNNLYEGISIYDKGIVLRYFSTSN
jgi:hypothetical protein